MPVSLWDLITEFTSSIELIDISPDTVFLTALAVYMERTTGKQDFVIGTPVLNRSNFKEKNMQNLLGLN